MLLEAWGTAQGEFHDMRAAESAKGITVDVDEAWSQHWAAFREKNVK